MRHDREALAAHLFSIVPDRRLAMRIANSAGVHLSMPQTSDIGEVWRQIIAAADAQQRIAQLLDVAARYADDSDGPTSSARPASMDDPLAEPAWTVLDEPGLEQYERQIGKYSTLLPVSFLRAGLVASRAICKITSPRRDALGVPHTIVGTGFLIGPDELLTCFHVLPNAGLAAAATVQFNYEVDENGAQEQPETVALAPDRGFQTSGSQVYDWTIVRTERPIGDDYGFLRLEPIDHDGLVFVNIIGHPLGQPKQVSLYQNLVEKVDARRVFYMTETSDGSSGSPVFDSQWRVVAMHNGWHSVLQRNMIRRVTRNAGINVNRIIERAGEYGGSERW